MCIKIFLITLSLIFKTIKILITDILKLGKGETLPGLILDKFSKTFLNCFFTLYNSEFVFVTGTNGKTSTTSIISNLLRSQSLSVVSNSTGSNLRRGVLSCLLLNFSNYIRHSPDYVVLELDEASVSTVLKSFPKTKEFSLLVLNLSRDQLDRYGEIDNLIDKINSTLSLFKSYNLILKHNKYSTSFKEPYFSVDMMDDSLDFQKLISKLDVVKFPHLVENSKFIFFLFSLLKIKLNYKLVSPFINVKGRGSNLIFENVNYEIHLSKNPASFNNNLKVIQSSTFNNVLIYMNDFIPDGHDVSWFYDIDYALLQNVLKNKNIYLCGTRSFDFYNFLKVLNISSFNFVSLDNLLKTASQWNLQKVVVLSNYSATQNFLSIES